MKLKESTLLSTSEQCETLAQIKQFNSRPTVLEPLHKRQKMSAHSTVTLLPSEIWSAISSCLMPNDVLAFIQCSKETHALIKIEVWKRAFEQRWLSEAHESMTREMKRLKLDDLIGFLTREKAIIAGSYPLMFLSKAGFKARDIDVFVPYTKELHENSTNVLDKHTFRCDMDAYSRLGMLVNPYRPLPYIRLTRTFISLDDIIVYIHFIDIENTKYTSMQEYISESFDLSFCKCWYDARSMGCDSVFAVIEKKGHVDYSKYRLLEHKGNSLQHREASLKHRVKKYRERGFTILNA